MNVTRRLMILTVAGLGLVALAAVVQRGATRRAGTTSSNDAPGGALRVQIDPVTGQMIQPSVSSAAPTKKSSRTNLVEEPGETEAGGFTVHARGHFRSAHSVQISNGPAPAR